MIFPKKIIFYINISSSTPIGSNKKLIENEKMDIFDKPLLRSNTGQNKEVNKNIPIKTNLTFNKKDNNIIDNNKNEINLNQKNDNKIEDLEDNIENNKNIIKNDNIINNNNIDKKEETEGFDAPPSIFNLKGNK